MIAVLFTVGLLIVKASRRGRHLLGGGAGYWSTRPA